MRCVPLFARRLPVALQHLVDMGFHRTQLRLITNRLLPFRRDRTRDRLTHHPPVDAVCSRECRDRLSGRVAEPDLFE